VVALVALVFSQTADPVKMEDRQVLCVDQVHHPLLVWEMPDSKRAPVALLVASVVVVVVIAAATAMAHHLLLSAEREAMEVKVMTNDITVPQGPMGSLSRVVQDLTMDTPGPWSRGVYHLG